MADGAICTSLCRGRTIGDMHIVVRARAGGEARWLSLCTTVVVGSLHRFMEVEPSDEGLARASDV